jgi:hypothetical protein
MLQKRPDKLGQFYVISLNRGMAAGEEKEVTMTSTTSIEGTRKRGRPRRNKTQRSGEAVVTKEETVITKKGTEPAKGIKVETQQVFKLVPKATPTVKKPAPVAAPVPALAVPVIPTKVTILPKKRVQKITILGKTPKKPLAASASASAGPAGPIVKQKITLPQAKKTRKQYKERRLRIEL